MFAKFENSYLRFVARVVAYCGQAAWTVLSATLLITAGLFYFTLNHLTIDTNTLNMLDERLPFRQAKKALQQAFPDLSNDVILVVEADTAVGANDLADQLAAKLREDRTHIDQVYEPMGGEFLAQHGLLYLDIDELQDLSDRLAKAQPLLGVLSQDTSLRGLFTVLGNAFEQKLDPEYQKVLARIADDISTTVEKQLAGKPGKTSWKSELFKDATPAEAGTKSFVLVRPRYDYSAAQPGAAALDSIRQLIRATPLNAEHKERIRLTGESVMDDEELGSVSKGAETASILSFVLVCILTIFGLRSPRHVIAILVTLLTGLIWTGAFAAATIGALNLISVNFAVLFIGMGVDFGIQVGLRYQEEMASDGEHAGALHRTGAGIAGALTLAAVAAAATFFAFVPTSYRGLAELGIIAGFSMAVALVSNLTVLPALLTVLPRILERQQPIGGALNLLGFSIVRWQRSVLWAAGLLVLGSLALQSHVKFDFNPLNMKDPTTESVTTFIDLLADPNTTPYTIAVLASNRNEARALAQRIGQSPLVDKTVTLESFVPEDQDEKLDIVDDMNLSLSSLLHPDAAAAEPSIAAQADALDAFLRKLEAAAPAEQTPALRTSIQRLAQGLVALKSAAGWPDQVIPTLRDNVVADLPQSLDKLRRLLAPTAVTLESLPDELRARYISENGHALIQVFPKEDVRDNDAMKRFVAAMQAISPTATDAPVDLVEGGRAVIGAAMQATLLAILVTVVLLYLVLRRMLDTVLVFVPLALAILLTGASSVVFDTPFDLANIIAVPLMMGLSNAYGIYFVLRVRGGVSIDDVFRSSTPRAILFSALTTMVSFGTLAFSPHRGMAGMGLLVTLSLTYSLICTLFVLPALMAALEKQPGAARAALPSPPQPQRLQRYGARRGRKKLSSNRRGR